MPVSGRTAGVREGFQGLRHLDRTGHGPTSALSEFLYPFARRDVVYFEDDFLVDTFNTDFWTTNAGTGATAWAVPATNGLGGTITAATGTDATAGNRVVNLYGPKIYAGDNNCGMSVRLQVSAITDVEFGIGFIDTHGTITTPIVLVGDVDDASSLASGMGDAALAYVDTAQTRTTLTMVTLGSGALDAGTATAVGTFMPAAATYFEVTVQLATNTATVAAQTGYGQRTAVTKASGIEGGTLVRPFVVISGVTATSRTYTIDLIRVWQDR